MMKWGMEVIAILITIIAGRVSGVSMNYYIMSCPMAELIVKDTVQTALAHDPTLAAGLLRMHFHDCFVQGCDASVLIHSTKDNTAEKDSPANLSLRGFEVIERAKEELEMKCPGVVSCADILALAARDAVFFAGGPFYQIPVGRKDGMRSKIEDTRALPPPFFNATQLIDIFDTHGFTAQEMVALSGAHTLGQAACSSFADRVSLSSSSEFIAGLARKCSNNRGAVVPLDQGSSTQFDNSYYMGLTSSFGLLTSDDTLYASPKTRYLVLAYAHNQARFFYDFQVAMRKMSLLSLKDNSNGQVRSICSAIN